MSETRLKYLGKENQMKKNASEIGRWQHNPMLQKTNCALSNAE